MALTHAQHGFSQKQAKMGMRTPPLAPHANDAQDRLIEGE